MSVVLVIAPHADDETLGCGGTLLRHRAAGDECHWLIVTDRNRAGGYSDDVIARREAEITEVASAYGFASVNRLGFIPARLDEVPLAKMIEPMGKVVSRIAPQIVYLPFRGDVHTDHRQVFDAGAGCTKWFRYPSVRRVLSFEVISETEMGVNPESLKFSPNYFVDISQYLARKIEICSTYESEMHPFPFPRSVEGIEALARMRGASCGVKAAESFMLLRETVTT